MPKRVNKAVELLEQRQPIYYTSAEDRGYEGGRALAKTWADYINYDLEHGAFDVERLQEFMRGLVDGGPTPSGHRTPAVIVTLPATGADEQVFRANTWMVQQVLTTGIHGILLCHAESPGAVKAFVESTRFPFKTVGSGLRRWPTWEWRPGACGRNLGPARARVSAARRPVAAEPERRASARLEDRKRARSRKRRGGGECAWHRLCRVGPGDMGMSLGFPDAHDPPYPPEMQAARARVLAACKANGLAFLEMVNADNVVDQLAAGMMIGAGRDADKAAEIGRKHTARAMPV